MSQLQLIRARRFAPLFATQFLGAFNDNVFRFALIIFVTFTVAERTGVDTRMLVVLTGGVFILPFFLFSALAGQIADKYEKSALIRRIKTAEIVVMGLGAVGFWLEDLAFLLAVLFLMGMQSTFFGPLKYAILPQHLGERELTGGNGLIQMGTYVAILVGGITGGMLAGIDAIGPGVVIVCVVALACLGRAAAAFIPLAPAAAPALAIDFNPLRSTWEILRQAAADRGVLTLVLLISGFWFVGATYLSVVPTFGKELLNANEQAVTLLNAAFTIGIGTGSLACERLSRSRIELGLVPFAALGISLASFAVFASGVPERPVEALTVTGFFAFAPAVTVFVLLAAIGAAGALFIVPLYAALQARTAGASCSRTLAALNVANALLMVVSAAFTMALYAVGVSVTGVFGIVGAMNLAAMGVAMAVMPEFRARARAVMRGRRAHPELP